MRGFFKGVFTFIQILIVVVVITVILVATFKPPPFKAGPFEINVQVHFAPCLIDITVNGTSKCGNTDHAPGGAIPLMNTSAFSAVPMYQLTPSLVLFPHTS